MIGCYKNETRCHEWRLSPTQDWTSPVHHGYFGFFTTGEKGDASTIFNHVSGWNFCVCSVTAETTVWWRSPSFWPPHLLHHALRLFALVWLAYWRGRWPSRLHTKCLPLLACLLNWSLKPKWMQLHRLAQAGRYRTDSLHEKEVEKWKRQRRDQHQTGWAAYRPQPFVCLYFYLLLLNSLLLTVMRVLPLPPPRSHSSFPSRPLWLKGTLRFFS